MVLTRWGNLLTLAGSLMCSTLLISESGSDSVLERFSTRLVEYLSAELKRSKILSERVF